MRLGNVFRLAAPAVFFGGCLASGSRTAAKSSLAAAKAQLEEAAIASAMQSLQQSRTDYRISSADLLDITVYREEDLGRTVRVSQNGTISLPLISSVKIGGKTVAEAERLIAQNFEEFLVNPQVTLFIKEYGNKKIYVLGEVTKPGSFDIPPESKLTVLEAISMAGGFSPVAAKDRTRIIRAKAGGQSEAFTVDVSAITKGEKNKDLSLNPNDVVFVPQSFF